MKAIDAKKELSKYAEKERAQVLQRFFKTGKGEYGEGDIFIGVTVPLTRKVAKMFVEIKLSEVQKILKSKIHEERLLALLILVSKFEKSNEENRKAIFEFYLSNTKYINNWDLVDLSSHEIIGSYLLENKNNTLIKLAKSDNLWEKRIAMVSTFAFIYKGDPSQTLKVAKILLKDRHDLIQKSVGWMLREVGKRNGRDIERAFLNENIKDMGRVAVRYALEHFDKNEREKYMLLNSKKPATY